MSWWVFFFLLLLHTLFQTQHKLNNVQMLLEGRWMENYLHVDVLNFDTHRSQKKGKNESELIKVGADKYSLLLQI